MPQQITKTVYTFDELSDHAKDRARDWFREGIETDDYSDHVLEDAVRIGEMLGFSFGTRTVKLMGGGTRQDPEFYWDLDRGSFVSFRGSYYYKPNALKAIKREAPEDTELHTIAQGLQDAQKTARYQLTAAISHRHNHGIGVEVERPDSEDAPTAEQADAIETGIRDFADWILSNLRKEYEYRLSDEAVDEDIRANEYTFTEDGKREG